MARLSSAELEEHLSEQIGFLVKSARMFDAGDRTEAKRLATTIRVLVHDTKSSHSLLGQLGRKSQMLDTSRPRLESEEVRVAHTGLVGTLLSAWGVEYVPNLDSAPGRLVTFNEWWQAPVIVDTEGREITRRKLILDVANQDGGAHVDPTIDEVYAGVNSGAAIGQMRGDGSSWELMPDLVHTSVRQIAHEVLTTLVPGHNVGPPRPEGNILGGIQLVFGPKQPLVAKVGRNEVCPCGSGKKYKKCHGGNRVDQSLG